jgi:hypothetical protein
MRWRTDGDGHTLKHLLPILSDPPAFVFIIPRRVVRDILPAIVCARLQLRSVHSVLVGIVFPAIGDQGSHRAQPCFSVRIDGSNVLSDLWNGCWSSSTRRRALLYL